MRSFIGLGMAASLAACGSQEPSAAGVGPTASDPSATTTASNPASPTPIVTCGVESGAVESGADCTTKSPDVAVSEADPAGSATRDTTAPSGVTGETNESDDATSGDDQSSQAQVSMQSSEPAASVDTPEPFPDGPPREAPITKVPSVRQEHGVVALNGEIYVLGGFTPSATAGVQAYSPATDTWRDVADFPVVFHHPNAAAIDGKLYVAGFLFGSSLNTGDGRVFSYDPSSNEWTPRTSMPAGTERGSGCVATLDSKLYVFGGASRTTMPDASVYDTVRDTWDELTFMPELREHCVAAAVDGKIYIVSGRSGGISGVGAASFVYSPATDTYDERAPIPTPRGGAAGALLHGRIFVFGGEGNPDATSGVFPQIEAYDPATDTWHTYPSMATPRHGYGAAALDDRIYLPGGATSQGFGAVDAHTMFTFQP